MKGEDLINGYCTKVEISNAFFSVFENLQFDGSARDFDNNINSLNPFAFRKEN